MNSLFRVFLAALSLDLLTPRVEANAQVYFSSEESVEREIVHLIEGARFSIDAALFKFTSRPIARALERARRRGVLIRLVIDKEHEPELPNGPRHALRPLGELRWARGKRGKRSGIMHHKFALFDWARVVTGSYNWTPGAEYANYENVLVTDDPQVVQAYRQEFETVWRKAYRELPSASRRLQEAGKKRVHKRQRLTLKGNTIRLNPKKKNN